jgi:hypothetical protein
VKLLKENFFFFMSILALVANNLIGPSLTGFTLAFILLIIDMRLGLERSIQRETDYVVNFFIKYTKNQKDKTDEPS